MFLAFREMARAKARFGMLIAAIGMLVFLILFQQSVQNGLLTSFVGAIRNQSAPVLVYSVDGQRVIQGSVIPPDLERQVREERGIERIGRIGLGTFTAETANGTRFDTTLIGYESIDLGAPRSLVAGRFPAASGEAVGSDTDASSGFSIGSTITIQPGGQRITIVGLAQNVQLNGAPTLFAALDDYVAAVRSVNSDALDPLPNVLAVAPSDGVTNDELVAQINGISDDLDALTRDDAADKTPSVSQVRQSFRVIFLLYALVIPCVTGLFFLIITFQKSEALILLRAIGAPARRLVGSLLVQAIVVIAAGILVGLAAYIPVSQRRLGDIPLQFETTAVIFWATLLMVLGVASALVAAKRVLAIDPIEAVAGRGDR